MEFESWLTPFDSGDVWLVDLSWGAKEWTLEYPNGKKYSVSGSKAHEEYDLIARVFHVESETLYNICYGVVNGYRCLDEHGLTELWNGNSPKKNTFKVKGHGWHKESPLTFFMGNSEEWSHLLVTNDECLEVVCQKPPVVQVNQKIEATGNAT